MDDVVRVIGIPQREQFGRCLADIIPVDDFAFELTRRVQSDADGLIQSVRDF